MQTFPQPPMAVLCQHHFSPERNPVRRRHKDPGAGRDRLRCQHARTLMHTDARLRSWTVGPNNTHCFRINFTRRHKSHLMRSITTGGARRSLSTMQAPISCSPPTAIRSYYVHNNPTTLHSYQVSLHRWAPTRRATCLIYEKTIQPQCFDRYLELAAPL